MKVLHAAAEVFPLIKTGGLADVVGALPQAQRKAGQDVRLVLPGFPAVKQGVENQILVREIGAAFGAGRITLRRGQVGASGLSAYVIDAPFLYDRDGNPYLSGDGGEWADNALRFALLGWVAAHLATGELDDSWKPDVLHAHDWHAAMACAYLAARPVEDVSTVYTIHNLAYQGLFDATDFHLMALPSRLLSPTGLEFHGQFSFMKAGLAYAHKVTTVSPSYAREIATEEFGCGLEGVVRARGSDVTGILNGVDQTVWNPAADSEIVAAYSAENLQGKLRCKAELQKVLGLRADAGALLFGVVSRLTSQKGLDLVLGALPALLALGGQLAVQGNGDAILESAFLAAAAENPGRVSVRLGYDEAFAHKMIAGSDVMLVPSRFEPCGLTQLYALRYGTIPIVRRVGGLADTVVDVNTESVRTGEATGFQFGPATAEALAGAVEIAVKTYGQKTLWHQLMKTGMRRGFSWDSAAERYAHLYESAIRERESGMFRGDRN